MSSQKLASFCSASDLPPANQSAGSTASTMTAVTFGSLWRIFAASSTLAPPCGVRAIAVRALDKAGIAWREAFWGRRRYSGGSRGVGGARCRAAGKTHSAIRLDRYRAGAGSAAAWIIEGDVAFECQRALQARGTANIGGDIPECGWNLK